MLAFTHTEAYQLTHQEGKVNLRLKIVQTWQECGSLRKTAKRLSISRNTVRKWVRRKEGEAGLVDRSRCPRHSPLRTPPEVEQQVLAFHRERGWGRRRIAHALGLLEGTVRHILRRHLGEGRRKRKKRKTFTRHIGPGKKKSRSGWPRWTPRTSWTKARWEQNFGIT